MGTNTFGPDQSSIIELAKLIDANVFIESGTFYGGTAQWASTEFEQVHTIELSKFIFEEASKKLNHLPNVWTHFGDTRIILSERANQLDEKPAVYWSAFLVQAFNDTIYIVPQDPQVVDCTRKYARLHIDPGK